MTSPHDPWKNTGFGICRYMYTYIYIYVPRLNITATQVDYRDFLKPLLGWWKQNTLPRRVAFIPATRNIQFKPFVWWFETTISQRFGNHHPTETTITLPETNSSFLKVDGWNTFSFPFGVKGLFSGANLLFSGRLKNVKMAGFRIPGLQTPKKTAAVIVFFLHRPAMFSSHAS